MTPPVHLHRCLLPVNNAKKGQSIQIRFLCKNRSLAEASPGSIAGKGLPSVFGLRPRLIFGIVGQ